MKEKTWLYDIFLDNGIVGDSGDLEFETKGEALADAHDYIISELAEEYDREICEFEVKCYERVV